MNEVNEASPAQAQPSGLERLVMCQCAAKSEVDCCCEGVDWRSASNCFSREKQLEALLPELTEYIKHDSWRCEKYGTCHCGLDDLMESAGLQKVPC